MRCWRHDPLYDYWKYGWGLVFALIYLIAIAAFLRHAWRSRSEDVTYNWRRVIVIFLAIGLMIYLTFIVQI
ncbi:hypothetical protein [Bradyrhizobium sp. USDA 4353]